MIRHVRPGPRVTAEQDLESVNEIRKHQRQPLSPPGGRAVAWLVYLTFRGQFLRGP